MTHISSELLTDKNLSLWLATIAILAFSAGYCLASLRHSTVSQNGPGSSGFSGLAMGKYGHISHAP